MTGRRMLRGFLRSVLAIVAMIVVYLAAALIGALVPGSVADVPEDDGPRVEIGLISGPIHVDFLLPATEETRAALGFASGAGVPVEAPWVEHIIIGWGAREFYTSAGTYADIAAGPVWRAVTGDRSVLRVDVFGAISPDADYPRLSLTPAQYSALLQAIAESATDIPVPQASFTPTDGFVEAAGRFHIFRTCNTWVSASLRAAGVPMGIWTPTPYSVRLSLARL